MQRKQKAFVIGSFIDVDRQIWSPNAQAFESVQEAIEELNPSGEILDDIAYELGTTRGQLMEKLQQMNPDTAIDALIHAVHLDPKIAIRKFRNIREAESFLVLIEQMEENRKREEGRRRRKLI